MNSAWKTRQAERAEEQLPVIPKGMPLLLQVDPGLELDELRDKFAFEIVAEQEEGYVVVAAEDIEATAFLEMLQGFSVAVHGSATVAKVHRLFDNPADRLSRILSDRLLEEWPAITDQQLYIVDVGIACAGTKEIPRRPKRGKRATDAEWASVEQQWSMQRNQAYDEWEALRIERETEILGLVNSYNGEILHMIDGAAFDAGVLPDSFTIRIRVSGKALKDFVQNYPFIFEVVEPEDISLPQSGAESDEQLPHVTAPTAPDPLAPAVGVIDSGIQEGHALIQHAIDQAASYCFLPGVPTNDVGDQVAPGGHGTRVAGAVLFGENVPKAGTPQLPFWIQNVRVLNGHNQMPEELFPPEALRAAVEHLHLGPRQTRIFCHSINASGFCRLRHMSAWAAEIDQLSNERDVLIVQSSGNLRSSGVAPFIGIGDHLAAGRSYPDYLCEPSARIANPAQSLQAITVGSISYGQVSLGAWHSFAQQADEPSAFSRNGPGIWNVIKPEVVEYGGDMVRTQNVPPDIQAGRIPATCPELVRSTMFPPGPAFDRDDVGTSFAAPKVARIAGELQRLLPDEPALLYRALVVQSAQWPEWAEMQLVQLRNQGQLQEAQKQLLQSTAGRALRSIGYGVPDLDRATTNTDHRLTLITSGETAIRANECHIYQVPIPPAMRQQADDFQIRIDATLSYVAEPRRTRRNLRRYLSTWVDWKSSNLGEGLDDFRVRALKDATNDGDPLPGSALPWTLHEMPQWGVLRDVKRNAGTVQKDWAIVRSNALPDHFCIAVIGHQGWSKDPDSAARYVFAVTFEIVGQEIEIYEPLREAVLELQAQVSEGEVELEVEAEEE